MKKIIIIITALIFVFSCAAFAATTSKKDDTIKKGKAVEEEPINRLDMSLNAGQFTQSVAAQAGYTAPAQAQPENQNTVGDSIAGALFGSVTQPAAPAKAAEPVVYEAPQAMGFIFDLMSIARSTIDPLNIDLSFSLVFGDYGNFGIEAIYYLQFLSQNKYFGGTLGLDIACEIFPLGNSPSGLYFGPIIGAKMLMLDSNFNDDPEGMGFGFAFSPGGTAGYRLNLGGFILDAAFLYNAVITFRNGGTDIINDFQFKFGIGGIFDEVTPEMVAAQKKKGAAK